MERATTKKSLPLLYAQYKDTKLFAIGLLVVTILIGICLILFFVVPLFQQWLQSNSEAIATEKRISVLKKNISLLQSVDENILSTNLDNVTMALPPQKDFGGAMQEILLSAVNSGVSLDGFTFGVGNVSSSSATPDPSAVAAVDMPLTINITAFGDVLATKEFIRSLNERLPLSVVLSADANVTSDSSTKISITFPALPIADIPFDKTSPLPQLSEGNRVLLDKLATWKENSVVKEEITDSSTSAVLLDPPF